MNRNSITKFIVVGGSAVAIIIVIFFLLLKKADSDKLLEQWNSLGAKEQVIVNYPYANTIFPPEIASPTFMWTDDSQDVNRWMVAFKVRGSGMKYHSIVSGKFWRPEQETWEELKQEASGSVFVFDVLGFRSTAPDKLISGGSMEFSFSSDSVGAPIFYRDVILPVNRAREHLDSIKWRLCDISSYQMAHVVLEELPVCGNCHSFSMDGSTFGMDIDASMDKGAYTVKENGDSIVISNDDIITWTSISRDPCLGLLSKVSPDGRYVITTIDDNSVLLNREDPMYSQFFFPIRGELAVYDKELDTMYRLPGACDPQYCQSNPNWSPDGKYIVFTRSKSISAAESGITDGFKRDEGINKPFTDQFVNGERDYKYDLYRIPFNEGRGGIAEPLKGASGNGRSNYFARYSPNGKWIVYCQAENFMLLMGDSRLHIIPAEGGEDRELSCNVENMNSYHSWSPNSKWVVVATKERGAYTQMYLTHIDEEGNSSPAVFVENATPEGRAVNIPEFVNYPLHGKISVIDNFTETGNYMTISEAKFRIERGEFDKALAAADKAIKMEPDNFDHYYVRAYVKTVTGDWEGAVKDYSAILKVNPNNNQALHNRGIAFMSLRKYQEAIADFSTAIATKKDDTSEYFNRAMAFVELGRYNEAIADFNQVIALNAQDTAAYINRGMAAFLVKNYDQARADFESALQIDPSRIEACYQMARVNMVQNKVNDAILMLTKALKVKPDYYEALLQRARAYRIKGDLVKGNEDIEAARAIGNTHELHFEAGLIRQAEGKFENAVKELSQAIGLVPNAGYLASRGDCYLALKDYVQAIRDYDAALNVNEQLAGVYFARGKAKLELGHKDEACSDLDRAFKLGYVQAVGLIQKNCVKN